MGVPNANVDILNAARAFASFSTSQSGIDPNSPDGPKLIAAYQKEQMQSQLCKTNMVKLNNNTHTIVRFATIHVQR